MEYPLHIRDIIVSDPFVLADKASGKYYLYAARFNPDRFPGQPEKGVFHALVSEDLVHWSAPQRVFEQGDFWADLDYWAPECHLYKGKYYLISSFRAKGTLRRCQCLVSDSPLGPFRPVRAEPVTPEGWQCLDGTLYVDGGGKPWMVFCHEWLQVYDGQIAAIPLSDDLGSAVGKPTILFRASDAPWRARMAGLDKHNGYVTDGPFLHRLPDGKLIMLWSNFCREGYATGYAVSRSGEIFGPWEQRPDPLYALDGAHSMLFYAFDGRLIMALHCPNVPDRKHMLLFEMDETRGQLRIVNELTGNWYDQIGGVTNPWHYREPYAGEPCI